MVYQSQDLLPRLLLYPVGHGCHILNVISLLPTLFAFLLIFFFSIPHIVCLSLSSLPSAIFLSNSVKEAILDIVCSMNIAGADDSDLWSMYKRNSLSTYSTWLCLYIQFMHKQKCVLLLVRSGTYQFWPWGRLILATCNLPFTSKIINKKLEPGIQNVATTESNQDTRWVSLPPPTSPPWC